MTVASPPPPPSPYGVPAPRKGMGPLGWIAIGCGAIALVGFLALAVGGYFLKKKVVDPLQENPTLVAAEMIVRMNPDLELVSSDPEKGTMTIKNTKTGETVTMNAEEIKEGKLSFETAEGTTEIDASQAGETGSIKVSGADGAEVTWGGEAPKNLPDCVPVIAGATVQGAMDATNAEERNASFALSTDESLDTVVEFYETKLEEAGLKVSKNTMEVNGERSATVTGTSEDEKRTVFAVIAVQDGKTQANINFTEKK
jgi:hypothetical protein